MAGEPGPGCLPGPPAGVGPWEGARPWVGERGASPAGSCCGEADRAARPGGSPASVSVWGRPGWPWAPRSCLSWWSRPPLGGLSVGTEPAPWEGAALPALPSGREGPMADVGWVLAQQQLPRRKPPLPHPLGALTLQTQETASEGLADSRRRAGSLPWMAVNGLGTWLPASLGSGS